MLVAGTANPLTHQEVPVRMASQINGPLLVRNKGLPHIGSREAPGPYAKTAVYFPGTNEAPHQNR